MSSKQEQDFRGSLGVCYLFFGGFFFCFVFFERERGVLNQDTQTSWEFYDKRLIVWCPPALNMGLFSVD